MKLRIFIALILTIIAVFLWKSFSSENLKSANSFAECVNLSGVVMESYPRRCNFNGQTFVENIGNEMERLDLIRIAYPRPNASVKNSFTITGEARGYWFFEASFPVEILDANGNRIFMGFATAQGEWMTEDFVPFVSEVSFPNPSTKTGTLILHKDNPSGLPENEDSLIVPISFDF